MSVFPGGGDHLPIKPWQEEGHDTSRPLECGCRSAAPRRGELLRVFVEYTGVQPLASLRRDAAHSAINKARASPRCRSFTLFAAELRVPKLPMMRSASFRCNTLACCLPSSSISPSKEPISGVTTSSAAAGGHCSRAQVRTRIVVVLKLGVRGFDRNVRSRWWKGDLVSSTGSK